MNRFTWNLGGLQGKIRTGGAAGVLSAASLLLEEGKRRAPVRTGRLRGSGSVSARDNLARVGFGAPYAQKVHEKEPFLREAVQDAGLRVRMLARMGEQFRF